MDDGEMNPQVEENSNKFYRLVKDNEQILYPNLNLSLFLL
ncbi:hypothetical protein OROGR_001830 [Orobanche gracilis]